MLSLRVREPPDKASRTQRWPTLPGQAFLVHSSRSRCYGGGGDANPEKHASSSSSSSSSSKHASSSSSSSRAAESTQRVFHLTGPELESAIRGCTAAAAYTSVPPRRVVQSRPNNPNNEFAPACARPCQSVPHRAATLVAETNLGFAGLALVGHKGRSGASSVAGGHHSTTLATRKGVTGQDGVDQGCGRQEKVLLLLL